MTESRNRGRGDIERLLTDNGLAPRKSLGQNFVTDPNTIDRIVRLAEIGPDDHVVEIGPGLGSLTLALEDTGARVVAFEIDAGLANLLREEVGERVTIIEQDAMTADFSPVLSEIAKESGVVDPRWVLVANLPYNVATPLVMTILENVPAIKKMIVMVQREVAERFVAAPSTKAFGSVTVRISYFAAAKIIGKISAEVFYPKPHVESALVEFTRLDEVAVDPALCSYKDLSSFVAAGFAQRRKMLRSSLGGLCSPAAFECADIAPTLRAENLDIAAWGKLVGCQRNKSSTPTPS